MIARGDVVVVAESGPYSSKPRPAVVIQAERLDVHPSVLVCLIVDAESATAAPFRIPVAPDAANRLTKPSLVQADRIVAIRREKLGAVVGRLDPATLDRLGDALSRFLGLA